MAYSLWITYPACLLSLYHQAAAKPTHYWQFGPLSSKTWQDGLAAGRTVGQDTVQVPCLGTSALEQSVPACTAWHYIPHPAPVPCIWGHAENPLYKMPLQTHCWFCLYGDSSQPLWPMNRKCFSLFTIHTLTFCAALDLNNEAYLLVARAGSSYRFNLLICILEITCKVQKFILRHKNMTRDQETSTGKQCWLRRGLC